MRATPTVSVINETSAIDALYRGRKNFTSGSIPVFYDIGPSGHPFVGAPAFVNSSGGTNFAPAAWMPGHWSMDAEL